MPAGREDSASEAVRQEAADWFARMRAPDAAGDAERLESWLRQDPAHREAYDRIARHWDQTAFLAHGKVGRSRDLAKTFANDRWPRRYAAVAGIAAFAVAGVVAIGTGLGEQSKDRPTAAPVIAHTSAAAATRALKLPDGSTVMLDRGAVVRLAYTADERRLRLVAGRARFTVAHESGRTFIVDAADGLVMAHGTVFDVVIEGESVRVVLLRGRIEVRKARPAAGSRAGVMLAPGQEVTFSARTPVGPAAAAPAEPSQTSMLELDGTPLADAVAEINRRNRRQIRLGNDVDGGLRVSGAYRPGDPAGFAQAVAGAFGLAAAPASDGSIVITARQAVRTP